MKVLQPTYTTKQPSTGKTIRYRPFTVVEEKAMLLALQEENLDTIVTSIKDLVAACTFGDIEITETPYFDIEYIFLKIRSKSVGESIELIGKCDCSETARTDFSVDIEQTIIEPAPESNSTYTVDGTKYSVQFRHPSIDDFLELQGKKTDEEVIIARCIKVIYDEDSVYENLPISEKIEFIESMTSLQKEGLKKFLENMPMVKLKANYKCKACSKDHEYTLTGFENFFV